MITATHWGALALNCSWHGEAKKKGKKRQKLKRRKNAGTETGEDINREKNWEKTRKILREFF